jgi:cytochrome c-type biogenesis protein CcmH
MTRLVLILVLFASPIWALDPSEKLDDPALEARARVLDHEIRCVQCQSEAVASSNAAWAQDARRAIREQIAIGASDAEVKDWFVARYGEFVLMDPPKTGSTLLLWVAGPLMLLLAGGIGFGYVRSRDGTTAPEAALSPEEQTRFDEIMKD